MITEEELVFKQIREHSPQWDVLHNGKSVAVVTERVIKTPPYALKIGGTETEHEDRDAVMEHLIAELNK